MKSMKIERKESEEKVDGIEDSPYPYSLRLHLDKDVIEKLGISTDMDIDQVVSINAKAFVAAISEYKDGNHESGSIELQITDMEVAKQSDRADKMYPNMES